MNRCPDRLAWGVAYGVRNCTHDHIVGTERIPRAHRVDGQAGCVGFLLKLGGGEIDVFADPLASPVMVSTPDGRMYM